MSCHKKATSCALDPLIVYPEVWNGVAYLPEAFGDHPTRPLRPDRLQRPAPSKAHKGFEPARRFGASKGSCAPEHEFHGTAPLPSHEVQA